MNAKVKKIKSILENFFDEAEKCEKDCANFVKTYAADIALKKCDEVKSNAHWLYNQAKDEIDSIVAAAIKDIREADTLNGDDITRDIELLVPGRFDMTTERFADIVTRNASSNTMRELLRKYAEANPTMHIPAEIEAMMASANAKVAGWEKVKAGALSLLDCIHGDKIGGPGTLRASTHRVHNIPMIRESVEGFMSSELSEQLNILLDR